MKKTLIALALFACVQVKAQKIEVHFTDYATQLKMVEQLNNTCINKMILAEADTSFNKTEGARFRYTQAFDHYNTYLKITFNHYTLGKVVELDQKGVEHEQLSSISGQFKDVFAIWKTHFNESADLQKIVSSKVDYISFDGFMSLRGYRIIPITGKEGQWQILRL